MGQRRHRQRRAGGVDLVEHELVERVEVGAQLGRRRVIERNTEQLDREHQLKLGALQREYDRETRTLQRDEDREGRVLQREEDRGNRLQDRDDEKIRRREDRDYDYETRDRNLNIQGKERDYGFETRKREVDVADKEQYAQLARQRGATPLFLIPSLGPPRPLAAHPEAWIIRNLFEARKLPYLLVDLDPAWTLPGDGHPDPRATRKLATAIARALAPASK